MPSSAGPTTCKFDGFSLSLPTPPPDGLMCSTLDSYFSDVWHSMNRSAHMFSFAAWPMPQSLIPNNTHDPSIQLGVTIDYGGDPQLMFEQPEKQVASAAGCPHSSCGWAAAARRRSLSVAAWAIQLRLRSCNDAAKRSVLRRTACPI